MSSNIEIQKICMLCGQPFIAKTTVTKYCSNRCCKNAHKQKLREEKINKTNQETLTQLNSQITPILSKEYLSVREVAVLLGIGKSTVHRYCVDDQIKCIRINRKIFIRRKDIETMFDNAPPYEIRERSRNPITEFYSMEEIMEKYNYKKGWIYKIIKDNETPKVFYDGRALYSRKHIDKVFSKMVPDPTITEWYSVEDIQGKYGMTRIAISSFVYDHAIPKKREGKNGFYSKKHFDRAKGIEVPEDSLYYTTEEAISKYNLTRDSLYYHIKINNVSKIKEGRHIKISKAELDDVFEKQPIIY
jgi:hypothetical protein